MAANRQHPGLQVKQPPRASLPNAKEIVAVAMGYLNGACDLSDRRELAAAAASYAC